MLKELPEFQPVLQRDLQVEYELCSGCGLRTEKSGGAVHKYLKSSPGCWANYGDVLVREYEKDEYWVVHELTVDAYALQHSGKKCPQTISSATVHLASLYSYFERGKRLNELHGVKKKIVKRKNSFIWLEPPEDLTAITVADILESKTASQHCLKIMEWAEYIFRKWELHYSTVARILDLDKK